ncbi:MAG: hypothetical protein EAZ55_10715 [Cytophagales bacterium]|nr:MAG: hypothetical protein EAZ55_10715 [Cytophagales bacterium]
MKPKTKNIIGLLTLLYCLLINQYPTKAQNNNISKWQLDAEIATGYIVEVPKTTTHLIAVNPLQVEFRFFRSTYGTQAWEQSLNYPRYGLTMNIVDFGSDILGEAVSALYSGNFTLIGKKRNTLNTIVGIGIGYINNPYDRVKNHKNTINGSHWVCAAIAKIVWEYKISPHWRTQLTAGVTHFSNGATQQPNWGTNILYIGAGLNYQLAKQDNKIDKSQIVEEKETMPKNNWQIYLAGAWRDQYPTEGPKYGVYTANFAWQRRAGKAIETQLGVDILYNTLFENYIQAFQKYNYGALRLSTVAGIEILMGKFSTMIQVGIYFYKPQPFDGTLYQRFGWKIYFNKNIFGLFALRSQTGSVDNLEFGVGYKIFSIKKVKKS